MLQLLSSEINLTNSSMDDFTAEQLQQNLEALIVALKKAKPSQAKGVYVKKVSISTTMGAGVAVDQNTLSTTVA